LEIVEDRVAPAVIHWNHVGMGDWGTGTNWDAGHVPGPTDDAVIDLAGAVVTHSGGTDVIHSLRYTQAAGSSLTLSGGILGGSGAINAAFGPDTAQGGIIDIAPGATLANATLAPQITLRVDSYTSSAPTINNVTINGLLDLTSFADTRLNVTSGLTLNGTANLGNVAGSTRGLLRFMGGQTLAGTGNVVFGSIATNQLVIANGGSPTTVTVGAGITIHGRNGTLTDEAMGHYILQGTIGADSGGSITINPSQSWENQGTITANYTGAATGGTIHLQGGANWVNRNVIRTGTGMSTVNLESPTTTANLGLISSVGATNGGVHIFSTIDNTGRTLQLNAATGNWFLETGTILGGTVETIDGTKLGEYNGATGHLDGVTLNGQLTVLAGAVQVMHDLTLNGLIDLYSGTQASNGLIFVDTETVAGTGTIRCGNLLGGAINVADNMTLTLAPGLTVTLVQGVNSFGNIQGGTGSTLINQGSISAESGGITFPGRPNSFLSLRNTGTIQATGGDVSLLDDGFSNQGTIRVQGASSGLEIGGNQTTAGLGSISSMGTVNLGGHLDNRGNTLQLNATTGNWNLLGSIQGGTIQTVGEAKLIVPRDSGGLNGVTLNGTVDVSADPGVGAQLSVVNGLTLNNGTIHLGAIGDTTHYGQLTFEGNVPQTLGGTGSIVFGSNRINRSSFQIVSANEPLTIGPGVTVTGDTGVIMFTDPTSPLINQGTIINSVPDGRITLMGTGGRSSGTIEVANGGSIELNSNGFTNQGTIITQSHGQVQIEGTLTTAQLGTVMNTDFTGSLKISGTLINTGNTLRLNMSTGSWDLGGTIQGGTIETGAGVELAVTGNLAVLDGVTLNGALDFTVYPGPVLSVRNGLTNNGVIYVGRIGNTTGYGYVNFMGTQALGGTGSIILGSDRSNVGALQIANNTTLTIGSGQTVGGDTGNIIMGTTASALVNNGTITDNVSGGTITISGAGWTNTGTVVAANGGTINADQPSNLFSNMLTGGTWHVQSNSVIALGNADIHTNAAAIILDSATSRFYRSGTTTDALANLSTNAVGGSFTIDNGRNFTTVANFTNNGMLTVGDTSTFIIPVGSSLTNFFSNTLTGGTFNISGQLQFPGANIVTNSATLTVGGSQAQPIFDNQNMMDGLRNLATNSGSGSFTFSQSGHTFTATSFTNNGILTVGNGATFIATTLTTFSSQTLTHGGHYNISGTFKFGNADIRTNHADLVLDGPSWAVVDLLGNPALTNLMTNASDARFCLQNNAAYTFASSFSNSGTLCLGNNNSLTLHPGDMVGTGTGRLELIGGTLVVRSAGDGPGAPVIINQDFNNQGTLQIRDGVTLELTGSLINYSAGNLTGGIFDIAGIFQFPNANIQTNSSTLILDGASAAIQDQNGNSGLAHLATNAAMAQLTFTNGANFTATNAFQNNGNLSVGPSSTFTANSNFTLTGTADIQGTGNLVLRGLSNFTSGNIIGSGTVTVPNGGQLSWTGGAMNGTGTTMIAASGALNISGTNSTILAGWRITNAGTVTWNGTGAIALSNGSVVDNMSGGMFLAQGHGAFVYSGGAAPSFVNEGIFRKSVDTGVIQFTAGISFSNLNMLDIQTGVLRLDGPVSDSGSLALASNAQVIENGALMHSGTATLQANASLLLGGGGSETGSYSLGNGARLAFNAGSFALNAGTSITGTGRVDIAGGTVSVNTALSIVNADIAAGTLTGDSNFTVTGVLTWRGGTMAGAGTTAITASGQLLLSGDATKYDLGRPIANNGTIMWDGSGAIYLGNGSTIDNAPGATFTAVSGAALLANDATALTFVNEGLFVKDAVNGSVTTIGAGVTFTNTGTVNLNRGTLLLAGGGTNSSTFNLGANTALNFAAGSFNLNAGSALNGPGLVQITGATVSFNTTLSVMNLTIAAGTLTGSTTVTVTTMFTWTGGTMAGSGMTMIGGQGLIGGGDTKDLENRPLCNGGMIIWNGSGDIGLGGGGYIDNESGASFTVGSDAAIIANDTTTVSFLNEGLFVKAALDHGVTTIDAGVTFSNTGTVDIRAGTLSLAGPFSNFDPSSGTLTGGTYRVADTFQFTGANLQINAATLVLDGSAAQVIDENQADGLANFALNAAGASFTVQNGAQRVTAGDFENDGTLTVGTNSAFTVTGFDTDTGVLSILAGGTLNLLGGGSSSGTLDVEGMLLLATGSNLTVSGSLTVNGSVEVAAGATLEVAGAGGGTGSLSVDGAFLLDAGITFSFQGIYSETGSLTVTNTALLMVNVFTNFDPSSGTLTGGTYVVAGTFQFTGANIITNAANIILDGSNSAILDQSGSDALAHFATNAATGQFTLQHGRTFTTMADFMNLGTLSLGADDTASSTFTVMGDYTQAGDTGRLEVQIGGSADSGLFGQLAVMGNTSLAGTLVVGLNDYSPTSDDMYSIVTQTGSGTLTGTFDEIDPPPGWMIKPLYSDSGVLIRIF
jgi:hypothetical protein